MKKVLVGLVAIGSAFGLHAQIMVWSQNFDSLALGTYGTTTDYGGGTPEATSIIAPGDGGAGNAMQVTFNPVSGSTVNFQSATPTYAASGNTSANLSDYTLSFDMAIQGVDISTGYGGLQISVQNGGGIFGPGAVSPFVVPPAGTANSGYVHYSYNLGTFTAGGGFSPTSANLAFGIGVVAYGNNMTASPETLLVDNLQITMVPEPMTMALCGLGLTAGLALIRRRRA